MAEKREQEAPSTPEAGDAGDAPSEVPRLRLRSLKVHAFRDVRPGTELRFGDGFHLVLGKNGSGKSTLLELLGAVKTLDFRRAFFADTPFHLEASFEVGEVRAHIEVKRAFHRQGLEVGGDRNIHSPPHEEAELVAEVVIPRISLRQWLVVRTGKDMFVAQADPSRASGTELPHFVMGFGVDPLTVPMALLFLLGAQKQMGNERMTPSEAGAAVSRLMEVAGTATPFDEALGALQGVTGGGTLSLVSDVRGIPNPAAWLPKTLHFAASGEPVVRDLQDDPQLKAAFRCLGYDGARMYFGPGAAVPGGWSYSSPSFQFFRNGKAVRRHDQLSFGQQRLFSFAWYLACNPDIAIADELVNGLHSEWIDWCVDTMGDRQCFLTSQNPLLVDAVPLSTEEDIRRGLILCEVDAATGQLVWRQLGDHETDLISRALGQSRLDLLSDLLHALDLW